MLIAYESILYMFMKLIVIVNDSSNKSTIFNISKKKISKSTIAILIAIPSRIKQSVMQDIKIFSCP